jgi:hypothetical protein
MVPAGMILCWIEVNARRKNRLALGKIGNELFFKNNQQL